MLRLTLSTTAVVFFFHVNLLHAQFLPPGDRGDAHGFGGEISCGIGARGSGGCDSAIGQISQIRQINSTSSSVYSAPETDAALDQPVDDAGMPAADSVGAPPVSTKRRLLPQNMSLLENMLWGESGFFRWVGIADTLSPQERKSELSARRFMLTAHQVGGFLTFAGMVAAVYYGQRGVDGDFKAQETHQQIIRPVIYAYAATALLALLSPPPLIRRDEGSTITTHKLLAWIHVAGMIVTPILAGLIPKRNATLASIQQAQRIHQISGYITTAVFGAALVTVTF